MLLVKKYPKKKKKDTKRMKILILKYKIERRIIVKSSLGWLGPLVGNF